MGEIISPERVRLKLKKSRGLIDVISLMDDPICFGIFCQLSDICKECRMNLNCKEIHPPKEPQWCNPE